MMVFFLCAGHSAIAAPRMVFGLMSKALSEDLPGKTLLEHIELNGGLSIDVEHGWDTIRFFNSVDPIDSLICFGKASASVNLPDAELLMVQHIRLPNRLRLTNFIRLPSPLSSWWHDPDNVAKGVAAIRPLLYPPPISVERPHVVLDSSAWN